MRYCGTQAFHPRSGGTILPGEEIPDGVLDAGEVNWLVTIGALPGLPVADVTAAVAPEGAGTNPADDGPVEPEPGERRKRR